MRTIRSSTMQINAFLCPSDTNVPGPPYAFANGTGSRTTGYGSYPNNIGTILKNNGGRLDGPAYHMGTPGQGGTVTLNKISDGLSNTAIFSEWIRGRNLPNSNTGLSQVYVANVAFPTATTFVPSYLPERVQELHDDLPGV